MEAYDEAKYAYKKLESVESIIIQCRSLVAVNFIGGEKIMLKYGR